VFQAAGGRGNAEATIAMMADKIPGLLWKWTGSPHILSRNNNKGRRIGGPYTT